MAAIIRASHALSFNLLNSDGHSVLGILDNQKGQASTLEIINSSRRDLRLNTLNATKASPTNHHFELKFRPGTLDPSTATQITVDAGATGWSISEPIETKDGVSLYLLSAKPVEIKSGDATAVKLNNLNAESTGGGRGTRVELKWKEGSLEYVASGNEQSEKLVAGHRVKHLEIVNERGEQYIPLHVGFFGTNQVLNDGKTVNTLTLRITNVLKQGSINLIADKDPEYSPSKLIISLDGSNKEWTMGPGVKDFKLEATGFKIIPERQGETVSWIISPTDKRITLGPGAWVDITIKNIVTGQQSGQTNLYLHYKNIPGYWDGDFVSVIEKAPLVYAKTGVGIGVINPQATLDVKGKVRAEMLSAVVPGKTGGGTPTPADGLHVVGNMLFGAQPTQIKCVDDDHRLIFDVDSFEIREKDSIVFSPGSVGNKKTAKTVMLANGNVGIGATNPDRHLHLRGDGDQEIMIESSEQGGVKWSLQSSAAASAGRFEIVNRSAPRNCFTILKDGNVGIGTVTPGSYINSGDYFKADAQGRILELHSPAHESVLILSSNQDADTATVGGLYFTRTKGNDDAHREVAAIKCKQAFGGGMAGGVLQFFTKPADDGTRNPRMVILENGNVGIGVTKPTKAVLEVTGSVNTEAPLGYRYMNIHKTENDHRKQTQPYSIWASHRIACDEFNAVSDERIKNIQGRSDGAADLSTLLGIEVTNYSYKDVIGKGTGVYKKVIGQQIEKVFPQAVTRVTDVVPDIYQQASIRDGWVALATNLKKGERVKLVTETDEDVCEVLEVTPDKFRVAFEQEEDKVFVFGREVNDFLTVDYDAISMLNVSATQQLKKEMDQEVKALRLENAELRAANDALAKRLQLLESKIEAALGVTAAINGSNGNGRH